MSGTRISELRRAQQALREAQREAGGGSQAAAGARRSVLPVAAKARSLLGGSASGVDSRVLAAVTETDQALADADVAMEELAKAAGEAIAELDQEIEYLLRRDAHERGHR